VLSIVQIPAMALQNLLEVVQHACRRGAICTELPFFSAACLLKSSPGAVVKLLPCDQEVMGSSPENSLLQKCRERLRT
jgi:hypothetical protein